MFHSVNFMRKLFPLNNPWLLVKLSDFVMISTYVYIYFLQIADLRHFPFFYGLFFSSHYILNSISLLVTGDEKTFQSIICILTCLYTFQHTVA